MTLLPEDMGGGAVQNRDGSYTVTDSSGTRFQMTESSFDDFISEMGLTVSDLEFYRSQVMGGSVVRLREGANPEYMNSGSLRDVDTVNLPFGGFDDAKELAEAYKSVVYPTRAEQIDRVAHGLNTGKVISEDIKTTYLQSDGNVTASVTSIGSEFDTRGGGLTENDVNEAREDNTRGSDDAPPADAPAGDDEQPGML
ncbi:hypothetical protein GCM10009853_019000 [Glycomyces scopariae]|uniref:Uncharacterized protein n=1 Tax=Glycomyces sambucus TaxID=380244 RepID=A0A1G9JSF5_9ACTN|nr:hypothetical protein [Glycomyces sambucus]SDL40469.1 hypothetical protein SAMN05216298_3841 [Glycomyces sambucus]